MFKKKRKLTCNTVLSKVRIRKTLCKCPLFVSTPYSRLYFVKDGDGFIKTAEGTINLEKGNVYLIPAELMFSYGCTHLEKIFFHVSVTTMEKYDLFSNVDRVCSLPFSEEEYNKLLYYISTENYEELLELKAFLTKIMARFATSFTKAQTPVKKYGDIVKNVIALVHQAPSIQLDVKQISERLFISESKVRNTFLEEMGIPIGKYIDDMVFIKAKKLLVKEQLSIAEISAELGFCDQFYFSRRFKQKFGETPSSFRKRHPEEFI